MTFPRMGLTIVGVLAVGVMGCPEPTKKRIAKEGGQGGDASGGTTGSGGRGSGGSTGSGGSAGGSTGSGGMAMGMGGRDAGSTSMGGMGMGGRDAGSSTAGRDGGGASTDARVPDGPPGAMPSAAFVTLYDTILKAKCGAMCHIGAASGTLAMPNAATAFANLVNKDSSCAGVKRVVPMDPAKSLLVTVLKYAAASGNTAPAAGCGRTNRMPKGGTALTAAEIKTIEDWITAGAK